MAKQVYSENAQSIITFLQANPNIDMTAKELAEALGLGARTVNGTVTGLSRKGIAVRDENILDNGKTIKYIHLTEAGKMADPFAERPEE